MPIGVQSDFELAFQEFVFYAGPIVQLLYWIVMIVAVLWAVKLLKRWVDFRTSDVSARSDAQAKSEPEEPISIEEFVE